MTAKIAELTKLVDALQDLKKACNDMGVPLPAELELALADAEEKLAIEKAVIAFSDYAGSPT